MVDKNFKNKSDSMCYYQVEYQFLFNEIAFNWEIYQILSCCSPHCVDHLQECEILNCISGYRLRSPSFYFTSILLCSRRPFASSKESFKQSTDLRVSFYVIGEMQSILKGDLQSPFAQDRCLYVPRHASNPLYISKFQKSPSPISTVVLWLFFTFDSVAVATCVVEYK